MYVEAIIPWSFIWTTTTYYILNFLSIGNPFHEQYWACEIFLKAFVGRVICGISSCLKLFSQNCLIPSLIPSTLESSLSPILIWVIRLCLLWRETILWNYFKFISFRVKFLTLEYCLIVWHCLVLHFEHWINNSFLLSSSIWFKSLFSPNLSIWNSFYSAGFNLFSVLPNISPFHLLIGSLSNLNFLLIGHCPIFLHSEEIRCLKVRWVNQVLRHLKGLGPQLWDSFSCIDKATWSDIVFSIPFNAKEGNLSIHWVSTKHLTILLLDLPLD